MSAPIAAQQAGGGPRRVTPLFSSSSPWLGRDKFKHVAAEVTITTFTYSLVRRLGVRPRRARLAAIGAAALAGVAKEVYDRRHDGTIDLRDLMADGVGTVTGLVVLR